MNSFFSRLNAALTVGIGGAYSAGLLQPKTALYIALGSAILQAFQHPVQATADPVVPVKPNA